MFICFQAYANTGFGAWFKPSIDHISGEVFSSTLGSSQSLCRIECISDAPNDIFNGALGCLWKDENASGRRGQKYRVSTSIICLYCWWSWRNSRKSCRYSTFFIASRRPSNGWEYVDIILVRMTSDLNRSPEKRYNYSNAFSGLVALIKENGVRGLTRGLGTNTVSHPVLNHLLPAWFFQFRAIIMNVRTFHLSYYYAHLIEHIRHLKSDRMWFIVRFCL